MTAPTYEGQPLTAAQVRMVRHFAARDICHGNHSIVGVDAPCEGCARVAVSRYPLPLVERPKVHTKKIHGVRYSVEVRGARAWYSAGDNCPWFDVAALLSSMAPEFQTALLLLAARALSDPTEMIDPDGAE